MILDPYRIRAVHLTAIWAYGVSAPVFSLVDANPDLVIARGATGFEVALLMVLLALVPPLVAVGYAWIASWFSRWAGDVLYLVLVGVFLVPIALQVAKRLEPGVVGVVLTVFALCIAGVVLYARVRAARLFVGFSIVLPAIGLVWFLNGLPPLTANAEAARVRIGAPHPVVVVVFDEFPLSSLMTGSGQIDAIRYPAFARLARDAVWYRNATSVNGSTFAAVPAILTGDVPHGRRDPIAAEYPENLFTLVGGSYDLDVHEAATRLCPPALCPLHYGSFRDRLVSLFGDVRDGYMTRVVPRSTSSYTHVVDFDTVMERESTRTLEAFDVLLKEVRTSESDRTLYFVHLYLPHAPWRFLPSGTRYPFRGIDGWLASEFWKKDPWPVLLSQQRHLLQVAFTDKVLGRLLRTLDQEGVFDRALIVVTADHGASFVAGGARRPVTRADIADIASVPMFVKYPGSTLRGIDDRGAWTIDLMPTIADVLDIEPPWPVDGVSLLEKPVVRPVVLGGGPHGELVSASLERIEAGRAATVRRKSAAFGEGADSLYRIGVHKELLGSRVDLGRLSSTIRVTIGDRGQLEHVDLTADVLPLRISGDVTEGVVPPKVELAVAVNGRIVALTRPWLVGGTQRFRALVPKSALRDGANQVQVYAITERRHKDILTRL